MIVKGNMQEIVQHIALQGVFEHLSSVAMYSEVMFLGIDELACRSGLPTSTVAIVNQLLMAVAAASGEREICVGVAHCHSCPHKRGLYDYPMVGNKEAVAGSHGMALSRAGSLDFKLEHAGKRRSSCVSYCGTHHSQERGTGTGYCRTTSCLLQPAALR